MPLYTYNEVYPERNGNDFNCYHGYWCVCFSTESSTN